MNFEKLGDENIFEKFSRWEILENFQLKSSFSRFFDFRKLSIEIQLFSIFRFSPRIFEINFWSKKMFLNFEFFFEVSRKCINIQNYYRNCARLAATCPEFFSPLTDSQIRIADDIPEAGQMSRHSPTPCHSPGLVVFVIAQRRVT